MKRALVTILHQAGLREDEIRLYLVLLQTRSATLSELQDKTRLSHTTTHRTIHRLIDRGLVSALPINKKQSVYKPLSLAALLRKVDSDQRRLQKLVRSLQHLDTLLPYLESDEANLADVEIDSNLVEIIDGRDKFCEEYLKLPELDSDEFLAIGSSDCFWQASRASIDSPLERAFVSRRLKNNVYSRSIMVATEDAEKIAEKDSAEKRTTKLKRALPITQNMLMICGDQVSHFVCDTEQPHVITIRNPELVTLHKQYFKALWQA